MSSLHDFEVCRGILESLPAGLCVIDVQKKIVFWSEGAERITGYLRHEVIGKSCIAEPLLYCDQPGCEFCSENCPLARTLKAAQPTEASGFLRHKAGHEVPVHARAVPVRNPHGSVIGVAAVFEHQHEFSISDHGEESRRPGCVDEITGVSIRDMLQPLLRESLVSFADMQIPFGILFFRLEHLDHFRASFGPEAASGLLRVVARTFEGALWKTDFVGRWSDDQFLIILNGCRDEALCAVRERLRHMLANDSIEWWGERRSLPFSVGHSTAQPGDTVDSLIKRAQKSLEAASEGNIPAAAASANTDSSHSGSANSGSTHSGSGS